MLVTIATQFAHFGNTIVQNVHHSETMCLLSPKFHTPPKRCAHFWKAIKPPKRRVSAYASKTRFEANPGLKGAYFERKIKLCIISETDTQAFRLDETHILKRSRLQRATHRSACKVSKTKTGPRRSQRDGQKSKEAEKALFIICCKKYPPRTHVLNLFKKAQKGKLVCFYSFQKSSFSW